MLAGAVQGQVRDRKRVKLGRVREEKEKFLSLTEFPDNLSLVSHLDYCEIFVAGEVLLLDLGGLEAFINDALELGGNF